MSESHGCNSWMWTDALITKDFHQWTIHLCYEIWYLWDSPLGPGDYSIMLFGDFQWNSIAHTETRLFYLYCLNLTFWVTCSFWLSESADCISFRTRIDYVMYHSARSWISIFPLLTCACCWHHTITLNNLKRILLSPFTQFACMLDVDTDSSKLLEIWIIPGKTADFHIKVII